MKESIIIFLFFFEMEEFKFLILIENILKILPIGVFFFYFK